MRGKNALNYNLKYKLIYTEAIEKSVGLMKRGKTIRSNSLKYNPLKSANNVEDDKKNGRRKTDRT